MFHDKAKRTQQGDLLHPQHCWRYCLTLSKTDRVVCQNFIRRSNLSKGVKDRNMLGTGVIRSYQWVWLWNARSDKRWSCLWKLVFFEPGVVSESDKGCESSLRSVSSGGCSQLMRVSLHIHANQPSLHLDPSHLNPTVGNIRQYFLARLKIRKYLCSILLRFDTSWKWLCQFSLYYTHTR